MFSLALIALLPLALGAPLNDGASTSTVNPSATSSASSPFATTTFSPEIPKGAVYSDPPRSEGRGRRIHPYGRSDLCVTVQNEDNIVKTGASVAISYCFSNDSPYSEFQLWNVAKESAFVNQYITLGNSTRVLDAIDGKLSANEVGIHDQGQKWSFSTQGSFTVDGGCLTVVDDSKPDCALPWGKVRELKNQECIGDATNQIFYVLPLEEEATA